MALDIVTREPLNAETPVAALDAPLTATEAFFVRNHFDEPALSADKFRLRLLGGAKGEATLALADLQALPQHQVIAVMECAGNGRTRMVPLPPGLPWGDRALGCASWEGPALADVLRRAPPGPGVVEVLFHGADHGVEAGVSTHFERSLALPVALGQGPILALRMNGAPLTRAHGAPLRVLVPGHYGVASVKWLTEVRYLTAPFRGFFQHDRYVYDDGSIVGELRPKSVLLHPAPGATVREGTVRLAGRAWGGSGGVAKVEAQVDDGPWQACTLGPAEGPAAWREWHLPVPLRAGMHRVRVRATDARGGGQPMEPVVNRLGYAYNTTMAYDILVRPGP